MYHIAPLNVLIFINFSNSIYPKGIHSMKLTALVSSEKSGVAAMHQLMESPHLPNLWCVVSWQKVLATDQAVRKF